jgi:hypothetical protein
MQLQPSKQIERGMVVEKPAEESVDLFVEDQLTSKENRLRKYLGDLETQPSQLHHYVRADSRSDFCVKTEIRGQLTILQHVVRNLALELVDLLLPFQQ